MLHRIGLRHPTATDVAPRPVTGLRAWLSRPWGVVPFQPVCYLVLWGAAIRLAVDPSPELPFGGVPGLTHSFYTTWLAMGVGFPLLALLSWWLIHWHSGRRRYVGMWCRLSADIGMFTTITAYHAAMAFLTTPAIYAEGRIYSRYVTAAIMIQIVAWIARDVGTLIVVERHAARLRHG